MACRSNAPDGACSPKVVRHPPLAIGRGMPTITLLGIAGFPLQISTIWDPAERDPGYQMRPSCCLLSRHYKLSFSLGKRAVLSASLLLVVILAVPSFPHPFQSA